MRKNFGSVPVDEVFAGSEKDPRWKEAYAAADLEVRIALQIADAREKARMTQGQLARALKTTQSAVSRIERGGQNLTLAYLSKLAAALGRRLVVELR